MKTYENYNKCGKLSNTLSYNIIETWLKNGCDPDYQDLYGETLIIKNAEHGSLDTVQMLINYGADVNLTNNYGNTVLHRFYDVNENIRESLVDLIINNDIDWQIRNDENKTFLDIMKMHYYSDYEYCSIYKYVIDSYPELYEKYKKHYKSKRFNL